MPIILSLFGAIMWWLVYLCFHHKWRNMRLKENIIVTMFIFIFLCYPIITNNTFALFNCRTLDNGISYLKEDYNVQCWTSEHTKMALFIGIPIIIVWVLGFPVYVTLILWRKRKELNKIENIV